MPFTKDLEALTYDELTQLHAMLYRANTRGYATIENMPVRSTLWGPVRDMSDEAGKIMSLVGELAMRNLVTRNLIQRGLTPANEVESLDIWEESDANPEG